MRSKCTSGAFILIFSVNSFLVEARPRTPYPEEITQQEETTDPEPTDFDVRQYVLGKKIEIFLKTRTRIEGEVIQIDDHSILMKASGVWRFTKIDTEARYRKGETILFPFEDIEHIEIAPKRKWGFGSLATLGIISFVTLSLTLYLTWIVLASIEG